MCIALRYTISKNHHEKNMTIAPYLYYYNTLVSRFFKTLHYATLCFDNYKQNLLKSVF